MSKILLTQATSAYELRVSVYHHLTDYQHDLTFEEVISQIKEGTYREPVVAISELVNTQYDQVEQEKVKLPAFTPAGTFVQVGATSILTHYNGLVVLEFDGLTEEELLYYQLVLDENPYTLCRFHSPSGRGLKVFVRVDSPAELHAIAFEQVAAFFGEILDEDINWTASSINRLCFLSFDRSTYYNPEALVFDVQAVDADGKYPKKSTQGFSCLYPSRLEKKGGLPTDLMNTPLLPDHIYQSLPSILRNGCNMFASARDRDIFLTGALVILSGCLDAVEGVYDQRIVYPNLNCFIIAPAASGKGALVYAKMLGQAYHDQLYEESKAAISDYEEQIYRSETTPPSEVVSSRRTKPSLQILFIPGNVSSAAIIKHLSGNSGKGIICETEADTLSNSLKQDWGSFSDLLRKAFHHEPVSMSRKGAGEYLEIKHPRLSVALSGTPGQIISLIPSGENGLFSRILFYAFESAPEWRDVSPQPDRPNLSEYFEELSEQVVEIVEYSRKYPTKFTLMDYQWSMLNDQFASWLKKTSLTLGNDAGSIDKRLGLMVFRLAMVLGVLRKYDEKRQEENVECESIDFSTAMSLIEVYRQHASMMYLSLPTTGGVKGQTINFFYQHLPETFKRKEAVEIGQKLNLSDRTVDSYLKQLLQANLLSQPKQGFYIKK